MNISNDSQVFVVFGGTGDLMGRKLLPALHKLKRKNLIEGRFQILGVARSREFDDAGYRKWAIGELDRFGIPPSESVRAWCEDNVHYHSIGEGSPGDYAALDQKLKSIESPVDSARNRLFYLALPPSTVGPVVSGLGEQGLNESTGWTRLVIEKPFGYNLESAVALNAHLHSVFGEEQIFRIDHYLGKETVQNLLVFRFANPVFESLWNRDRVESVHILVAEELGVGDRAGYYDRSGALRDMVQNHLAQLFCLTAMEVPAAFDADSIRDEKVKVLRSTLPISPDDVVLGRYRRSQSGEIQGYLEEPGIPADSTTETFAALRLQISNWRWQGVPFYLRTGKRLPERRTKVTIRFKSPPVELFDRVSTCKVASNQLVITLQPQEGFDLNFEVKAPGEGIKMQTQRLQFRYADAFGDLPEAYETLLLDALEGDQTLFVRGDEAERSWELFTPVLDRKLPVFDYPAGSWGPSEVDRLYE